MKSKFITTLILVTCFALSATAQIQTIPDKKVVAPPNVSPKIFRVLSINFVHDSSNIHGTTRETYLTETITYVGTGVVDYTEYKTMQDATTRSLPNGTAYSNNAGNITLSGTGTDVIHLIKSAFVHSQHTMKIETSTPNQVVSNTIGY
jgi:hypothetical protein